MKVTMEDFAALLAAAIWADGVYAEAEKNTLDEIAGAFELNAEDLKATVEIELEKIKDFDDTQMQEYVAHAGAGVAAINIMSRGNWVHAGAGKREVLRRVCHLNFCSQLLHGAQGVDAVLTAQVIFHLHGARSQGT